MKVEEICVCGHLEGKHRTNKTCKKCGCKSFSKVKHESDCRCELCAWAKIEAQGKRIFNLEGRIKKIEQHLSAFRIIPKK